MEPVAKKKCPVCESEKINIIEKIKVEDIIKLYLHRFNYNIGYLFTSDEIYVHYCNACDLIYFAPNAIADEKLYDIIQDFPRYYKDEKEEYHYSKKYIKTNDNLLEIGCGKGTFSKFLNNINYTGLEINNKAAKIAQNKGINVINETVQKHAVSNSEYYNVICTFHVLEHIPVDELNSFLNASIACLKKDGTLIISVPNNDSYLDYLSNAVLNIPPHHQTRWKIKTFHHLAEKFNLSIIDVLSDRLDERFELEWLKSYIKSKIDKKSRIIDNRLVFNKIIPKFVKLIAPYMKTSLVSAISPVGQNVTVVLTRN